MGLLGLGCPQIPQGICPGCDIRAKISARLSREGWMRFAGMEWECWGVKVPVPLEVTLPEDTEIPGSCLQSLQERGARSE